MGTTSLKRHTIGATTHSNSRLQETKGEMWAALSAPELKNHKLPRKIPSVNGARRSFTLKIPHPTRENAGDKTGRFCFLIIWGAKLKRALEEINPQTYENHRILNFDLIFKRESWVWRKCKRLWNFPLVIFWQNNLFCQPLKRKRPCLGGSKLSRLCLSARILNDEW